MCSRAQIYPVLPNVFPEDCDGHLGVREHLPNIGCFYRIGEKLEKLSLFRGNLIRYRKILNGTEHILGKHNKV